jgi:undecaprenyl-diphosphatase
MTGRVVAAVSALAAFAVFLVLGKVVDHGPDPAPLFALEAQLVNHSTLIAWWLTWGCFVQFLVPVCLVLIGIAVRFPQWRWRIAFSIVAVLLAWRGADFFQHIFARPRRLDWVVKHETSFSFPSSHAAVVTAFYWYWAAALARSSLRHKGIASALLAVLGFAILWSRLALGAHYATDLLGGVLWGAAVVAALAAAWPRNVFERQSAPALE